MTTDRPSSSSPTRPTVPRMRGAWRRTRGGDSPCDWTAHSTNCRWPRVRRAWPRRSMTSSSSGGGVTSRGRGLWTETVVVPVRRTASRHWPTWRECSRRRYTGEVAVTRGWRPDSRNLWNNYLSISCLITSSAAVAFAIHRCQTFCIFTANTALDVTWTVHPQIGLR